MGGIGQSRPPALWYPRPITAGVYTGGAMMKKQPKRVGSWGKIEPTQEELLTQDRHDNGRSKDRVLADNDYYPTIEPDE